VIWSDLEVDEGLENERMCIYHDIYELHCTTLCDLPCVRSDCVMNAATDRYTSQRTFRVNLWWGKHYLIYPFALNANTRLFS